MSSSLLAKCEPSRAAEDDDTEGTLPAMKDEKKSGI